MKGWGGGGDGNEEGIEGVDMGCGLKGVGVGVGIKYYYQLSAVTLFYLHLSCCISINT